VALPPPAPAVDILVVVDNSGSMAEAQAALAQAMDALVGLLTCDAGVDFRVGFTTTDMGNPMCSGTTPEGGKLRLSSCRVRASEFVYTGTQPPTDVFDQTCGDVCVYDDLGVVPTVTDEDPQPAQRPWIELRNGAANVSVPLADALACAAPQGIDGCGFESPLEAMARAIEQANDPSSSNYGFLRDDAALVVIIVTDEADCSARPSAAEIFDGEGSKVFWSDPGVLFPTSAVCWNAGVSCTGGPGFYDTCDPVNKDASGTEGVLDDNAVLFPLARYVEALQAIRDAGRPVAVQFITGVPPGYAVPGDITYQDASDPTYQDQFGIGPGCSSPDGEGVPPVRLRDVAEAMRVSPAEPPLSSVCAPSTYATAIRRAVGSVAELPASCQ